MISQQTFNDVITQINKEFSTLQTRISVLEKTLAELQKPKDEEKPVRRRRNTQKST